jgi:hypothetical protein
MSFRSSLVEAYREPAEIAELTQNAGWKNPACDSVVGSRSWRDPWTCFSRSSCLQFQDIVSSLSCPRGIDFALWILMAGGVASASADAPNQAKRP